MVDLEHNSQDSRTKVKTEVLFHICLGFIAAFCRLFHRLRFSRRRFDLYGRMDLGQADRIHVARPQRQTIAFDVFAGGR